MFDLFTSLNMDGSEQSIITIYFLISHSAELFRLLKFHIRQQKQKQLNAYTISVIFNWAAFQRIKEKKLWKTKSTNNNYYFVSVLLFNTNVLVIVRNLSWPAVSLFQKNRKKRAINERFQSSQTLIHTYHICNLTRWPLIRTVRILKSTPIVVM